MRYLSYFLGFMVLFLASPGFTREPIRYAALGDSYTIGTGAQESESWPRVLTERLKKKGAAIELIANLGVNGWTTQNLIEQELPLLKELKPNFVTVLIGVNDWVQGVPLEIFEQNFQFILDYLLRAVPDSKNILVLTIPDFSVTPAGKLFSGGRDISKGIAKFNHAVIKEAGLRHLKCVDLYPLSKKMGNNPSLISPDGLHPSAKTYSHWAEVVEGYVNWN